MSKQLIFAGSYQQKGHPVVGLPHCTCSTQDHRTLSVLQYAMVMFFYFYVSMFLNEQAVFLTHSILFVVY